MGGVSTLMERTEGIKVAVLLWLKDLMDGELAFTVHICGFARGVEEMGVFLVPFEGTATVIHRPPVSFEDYLVQPVHAN